MLEFGHPTRRGQRIPVTKRDALVDAPVPYGKPNSGNSVGRRITTEVSKGVYSLPPAVGVKRLKGLGEEAAQHVWTGALKAKPTAAKPPVKVMKRGYEVRDGKYHEVDEHKTRIGRPGDLIATRRGYDTTGRRQALGGVGSAMVGGGALGGALEHSLPGKTRASLAVGGTAALAGSVGLLRRAQSHSATAAHNYRTGKTYVAGQKRFSPPQKQMAKRYYDPEAARQRRLGVVEGATGVAGGRLAYTGGKPVVTALKASRGKARLSLPKKATGKAGAGVGLMAAAAGLHGYSASTRNRTWR
jgi:hypothetical protein